MKRFFKYHIKAIRARPCSDVSYMRIELLGFFAMLLMSQEVEKQKKGKKRWKVVFTATQPRKKQFTKLLKSFSKQISTHVLLPSTAMCLWCREIRHREIRDSLFVFWFFMASRFELFWIHKTFFLSFQQRQHLKFQCRRWKTKRQESGEWLILAHFSTVFCFSHRWGIRKKSLLIRTNDKTLNELLLLCFLSLSLTLSPNFPLSWIAFSISSFFRGKQIRIWFFVPLFVPSRIIIVRNQNIVYQMASKSWNHKSSKFQPAWYAGAANEIFSHFSQHL